MKKFLVLIVHFWVTVNVSLAVTLRDDQNVKRPARDENTLYLSAKVKYTGNNLIFRMTMSTRAEALEHFYSSGYDIANYFPACKLYSKLNTNRIVGDSQVAQRGEFPWMAALGVIDLDDHYKITFVCGGTIISDYFVMTAAHCLSNSRLPNVVRLGKLTLNDKNDDDMRAESYYIKEIIEHPDYSIRTKKNDIGLVRTAKRILFTENVKPACLQLDARDEHQYKTLTVTGWGITDPDMNRKGSNILIKGNLLTFPLAECSAKFAKYKEKLNDAALSDGIFEGQYCAYDPTPLAAGRPRTDSCQGDSGGPLQYISPGSSIATIVGIVSFGVGCGTDLPGVYTRVAFYLDWIEAIVWGKPMSRSQISGQAAPGQGKNYFFETFFKASWFKAYLYCKSNGKSLASITLKEENDKIVSQIKDAGRENDEFWTSGLRVDSQDFYWAGNGKKFGYTDWERSNERTNPDNFGGDQYCMQLWGPEGLKWDDTECYAEKYFVCEDGVQESSNAAQTSNQAKRYTLVPYEVTWFKAFLSCKSNSKRLVSIMSQTEDDEIIRLIREAGLEEHEFWTSGVRIDQENWYWMGNGKKFGFLNWAKYRGDIQPDNLLGNQFCLQLWVLGALKWDDTECYRKKFFVCEE